MESLKVVLGTRVVIENLSVKFERGQVIGLVGPNGSGKSTLLRALYGYLTKAEGTIHIEDRELEQWAPIDLASHLGVCPQEAESSLDFEVAQLLSLRFQNCRQTLEQRLENLTFLKLPGLFGKRLSELSGGERQRVRLGTALLSEAPWLVLDEPANHLDLATAWSVLEYLTRPREGGVLLALHDLSTAARCCHQVLVLQGGQMVAFGPPSEVLTQDLLKEVFGLQARLVAENGVPAISISGACRE